MSTDGKTDLNLENLAQKILKNVQGRSELSLKELKTLSQDASLLGKLLRNESVHRTLSEFLADKCVPNVIGEKWTVCKDGEDIAVTNPSSGEKIVSLQSAREDFVSNAIDVAENAQRDWGAQNQHSRASVMFSLREILLERIDEFAHVITLENGKLHHESVGEIRRGIECVETATSYSNMSGSHFRVTSEITGDATRVPLGVVAGATPFNFPMMIPLWMAPAAIVAGNAFILKPSEQTPVSAVFLAEAFKDAGLPPGIFQVVHGNKETVSALIAHQKIKAFGFVGSTAVAQSIYTAGSRLGKPVRALGGAKNPIILTPEVDVDWAAKAIVSSATDCAGQRCMAASLLIALDGTDKVIDRVEELIQNLEPGKDLGPLISPQALERVEGYLERAESNGAKLVIDGRNKIKKPGNYIGASLIDHSSTTHEASCDEIFGPVLTIVRAKNLENALEIENHLQYGNAASILTNSLSASDYFKAHASAGMLGVNIPVPVPSEPRGFGGTKDSNFGGSDLTGNAAFDFWTNSIKVTGRSPGGERKSWTD